MEDHLKDDQAARRFLEEAPRVWPYLFAFAMGHGSAELIAAAYGAPLTKLDVQRLYNAAHDKALGTLKKHVAAVA